MKRFDFPVSLDVRGRRCVVIGGGFEATDKALKLATAGAKVQVISAEVEPPVASAAAAGTLGWAMRTWEPSDLTGAFLVIVTPEEWDSAAEVQTVTRRCGALLCVIDVPELCDFANPASVRAGDLFITLSTGGRAPALLRRLREGLERALSTRDMALFLEALAGERAAAPPGERSRVGRAAVLGFEISARVTFPRWFRVRRRMLPPRR